MSGCIHGVGAAVIVVACGAAIAPAFAASASCWDGAMTQMQMNICADADFRNADQALDQVYRQMRNVAGGGVEGSAAQSKTGGTATTPDYLQAAQRAWLSYRDKECLSRTNGGPHAPGAGSVAPMEYAICLTTLTKARVVDLRKQSACPQRDAGQRSAAISALASDGGDADCAH